ncbi:hypothetical protein T11_10696 [Trichinella zimbabwensis]|uniref:Uncharacterized protein n=1 Tax=Trichinella zimbabwensis TaxID=268475 RepID=A0A0V1I3T3_9BILA|nr:hypothetical protein T11_10696 [Trichinella zimbabwensis]
MHSFSTRLASTLAASSCAFPTIIFLSLLLAIEENGLNRLALELILFLHNMRKNQFSVRQLSTQKGGKEEEIFIYTSHGMTFVRPAPDRNNNVVYQVDKFSIDR